MTDFLFSVPSGETVTLEPFHYAIIGQTQFSGKTTLIKRLSDWVAAHGYMVLVFDTKETEADYAGFGEEVPVCLRETTDSFVLIGLLESMFRRRLTPYYATLSRLTEAAKGFDDIIARAKELEVRTKSSWLKDACRVLYDLLERLRNETAKVETVPKLKLYPGINRMVINDFSLEAQQLIVKNAFEDALTIYKRKLVLVIDEAFKFIPQGYSSAATRAIMNLMTQGAKTGLFGWISTQFLAVTDKDPLKACAVKFLGTQDHITEVKHTLDLIPEARGKFSSDDIMKLKLGHWVLVRKRPAFVGVVYALPVDVPRDVGCKVALGELSPEHVRDHFLKVKVMEVNDEVYREKYEELKRQYAGLKNERDNLAQIVDKANKSEHDLIKEIQTLKVDSEILKGELVKAKGETATQEKIKDALRKFFEALNELSKADQSIMPWRPAGGPELTSQGVPSEVSVSVEQPTLTIQKKTQPLSLNDSSLEGKIAIVYAEGQLPRDKWFSVSDVTKAFVNHGWSKDPRTSTVLDKFCQWGFFEKHHAGRRPEYRLKMKPENARGKGLLKEVEA